MMVRRPQHPRGAHGLPLEKHAPPAPLPTPHPQPPPLPGCRAGRRARLGDAGPAPRARVAAIALERVPSRADVSLNAFALV